MPDMPAIALLLAKKKPQDDEMSDDMHSKDDTLHAVMSAFIDAVRDKDVEAACESFKDLKDLCEDDEDQDS